MLDPEARYVVFGGNIGGHRGRSYRIIGNIDNDLNNKAGWLRRVGYKVKNDMPDEQQWAFVNRMLGDLDRLKDKFQLTSVAIGKDGKWKALDEMLEMVRRPAGRQWLARCRLQVFAPDNHLVLWRRWFAEQLGFSFIPGGEWASTSSLVERGQGDTSLDSPEIVKVWLRKLGLNQKQLASMIGWNQSRLSRQLTGATAWSPKFQAAVQTLQGEQEQSR